MSNCSIVYFDPGVTTGVAILTVDRSWIAGGGRSDLDSMREAVHHRFFAQLGDKARESWPYDDPRLHRAECDGPADSPLMPSILLNQWIAAGGPMTDLLLNEVTMVLQMQTLLDEWPDAAWGFEDFIPRGMNASREFLSPVRLGFGLTFSELSHGGRARRPFVQQASTAKTTATNDRLKSLSLYQSGMPHATDAMRHAVTLARRCRQDAKLRAQAWPLQFS